MKGGLTQMVLALRTLDELGLEPPLTPVVFVNADEEIGSRSSTRYIRMLARRAARAYVLEPAMGESGAIKTECKGIGRFTITVFGKAAHAGLDPEGGASAILELSHVIQQLFALNDPAKGITVNVGTIDGGLRSNVVAPQSTASVDVRVVTLEQAREVERAILALKPQNPDAELEISGGFVLPPMEATPRNQALWRLAQAAAAELGIEIEDCLAGGGSDGNIASQYAPTLDGLGPLGDGAHALHEHVVLESLEERGALLGLLLLAPPMAWPEQAAVEP
jgi:glutamate carboxypeptidase